MSSAFGMELGMNFINKGIDQFTYGVSEEYNKYKYEKARDDAYTFELTKMDRLMRDAERFGIHPLALLGAGGYQSKTSSVGFPSTSPPSGGGISNIGQRQDKELQDLEKEYRTEKVAQEKIRTEMMRDGQGMDVPGTRNVKNVIKSTMDNPGVAAGVNPKFSYERGPAGIFNMIHTDTEAYSDEAPLYRQVFDLIDTGVWHKNTNKLFHNWNDPSLQGFKKQMLATRPTGKDLRPGEIALMTKSGRWKAFPKTSRNKDWIYATEVPGRNLRGGKKHAPSSSSYVVN